jgi:hypothetical protein
VLTAQVASLSAWLAELESPTPHQRLALDDINRWWQRSEGTTPASDVPEAPPGSPIGQRRNR